MAYFDLKNASNYNAKHWLETSGSTLSLPVDPRPLRDGPSEHINAGSNVVKYQRKSQGDRKLDIPTKVEPAARPDVFFVDDAKTPAIRFESPVRRHGVGDDDIMFIE